MTLVQQLQAALESTVPSDQVRTWLWLKFIAGGRADMMELRAQYPSDFVLIELMRIKLIRVVGTDVIAEDWGVGSSSDVTPIGISISSDSSKGTDILTSSESTTAPEEDSSSPKPTKPARVRKAKTPPKRKKKRGSSSRGKLARLSGRELTRAAFANPKLIGASEAIENAIEWVFRRYNAARKRQSLRTLPDSQRSRYRGCWRGVAQYVIQNDVAIDAFFDFAYKRTRWQGTAFPTPHVLKGPWLRGEWETRSETRRSRHAGHSYEEADSDLGTRLADAGFDIDGLGPDDFSFIEEHAELLRTHPEHYTKDEDWHDLIEWVAGNLEGS